MIARQRSAWSAGALAVAALVVLPLVAVAGTFLVPRGEVWAHLYATILGELTWNTAWLLAGVALLTSTLGTGLAWLVVMHHFPGRRVFEWALVLPLVVPAYVSGFVWIALLEYSGPFQTTLRALGVTTPLPDVRSGWMAMAALSLALYPYPYLLARQAFGSIGAQTVEAARGLGASPGRTFRRVALPLARPAVAAGTTLAVLESLSDFGTVTLFDLRTYTVGIYRVWFGMFDREAAGQLASVLLAWALVVLLLERVLRGRRRFVQTLGRRAADVWPRAKRPARAAFTGLCGLVVALAFAVPVGTLVTWSLAPTLTRVRPIWEPALNSLVLAGGAALVATLAALLLAYARRLSRGRLLSMAVDVSGLGYAMPGSVVAVGVLAIVARVDQVAEWTAVRLGLDAPALVTGTALALLAAYLVRFIAVAFHPLETGFGRVRPSLDEAASSLGAAPLRVMRAIHLPLLAGPAAAALLLVFMDVMKELPATMLMRPRGWDTLAVEVWQLTTESLWREAALPSLAIVAASLPAVVALMRMGREPRWQP